MSAIGSELRLDPIEEAFAFAKMQRDDHFELCARGIAEVALASETLTPIELDSMNDTTINSVAVYRTTDYTGIKELMAIHFITPNPTSRGVYSKPYEAHTGVCTYWPSEGRIETINDFHAEHSKIVIAMIKRRALAKHLGLFPSLKANLSSLEYPLSHYVVNGAFDDIAADHFSL